MQPFAVAGGFIATNNPLALLSLRPFMSQALARPSSTASFASSASTSKNDDNDDKKPHILCLHGKFQSGSSFSNKIGGARRKIAREYTLDFLDGPILLDESGDARSWWHRSDDGKHTLVREAFEYVIDQTEKDQYEAIIGFSQGGTLATVLALSGALPNVRCVITAGSPFIEEAFEVASELSNSSSFIGYDIAKLHLAGETDAMVPADSTRELCEKGGNGKLILHEQGHLFPTRSARVKEILDFLGMALSEK